MNIDQFSGEFTQACAGLPGDAEVIFKCIAGKDAGKEFSEVSRIAQIGAVKVVYPNPDSQKPAYVLVEFA